MNAREEVARAVQTLLTPGMGVLAKAGAEAVIRSHHRDPDAVLAEARAAVPASGLDGPLRKMSSASTAQIVVTGPLDDGRRLRMEMPASEGVSMLRAVRKALREVGIYE